MKINYFWLNQDRFDLKRDPTDLMVTPGALPDRIHVLVLPIVEQMLLLISKKQIIVNSKLNKLIPKKHNTSSIKSKLNTIG